MSVTKPTNSASSKVFSDEEESDGDDDSAGSQEESTVSEGTEEKVIVAKIWMENYYDRLFNGANPCPLLSGGCSCLMIIFANSNERAGKSSREIGNTALKIKCSE